MMRVAAVRSSSLPPPRHRRLRHIHHDRRPSRHPRALTTTHVSRPSASTVRVGARTRSQLSALAAKVGAGGRVSRRRLTRDYRWGARWRHGATRRCGVCGARRRRAKCLADSVGLAAPSAAVWCQASFGRASPPSTSHPSSTGSSSPSTPRPTCLQAAP